MCHAQLMLMLMPLAFIEFAVAIVHYSASPVSVSEWSCSFWRAMHQNTCIYMYVWCVSAIKLIVCFTLWVFTIKAFSRKSFAFRCNQTRNHYLNTYLCAASCIAVPHVTLISHSLFYYFLHLSSSPLLSSSIQYFRTEHVQLGAHIHSTHSSMGASEWNFNYILHPPPHWNAIF